MPVEELQQSFGGGQRDRDHPSLLAENEYYKGVNLDGREGGAGKTRQGWRSNTIIGTGGNFQGAGYFTPTTGTPFIIQVNDGKFYKWDGSSQTWTRVGTVQLNNVTGMVTMAVLANKLFVACGVVDNCHSWDGIAAEFTDEGNTNADAPRGNLIWMQSDRLCMAGVDSVATVSAAQNYVFFSDINDGTTWDRTTSLKRVPTQTGDPVTGGAAYRNEEILVFTRNSTHLFNITGSSVTSFTRTTVSTHEGCIAHNTITPVGDDCYFMSSDRHIRTVKRTVADISLGVSVPISYFNDNLMSRIHEVSATRCAGVFFDNYYLLGCPLDGDQEDGSTTISTTNNNVIAFDNLQQKQGVSGAIPACYGEWTNIDAGQFVVGYFNGRSKLYFIDSQDGNCKEMFAAQHDDGIYPPVTIKTRGFSWGAPNFDKTAHSLDFQLLETFGTFVVSYAKDDGAFTQLLSTTISGSGATLPLTLPFTLTAAGILSKLPIRMYRKGRSRYWQLKLEHTGGVLILKQLTMRAFVEQIVTRSLQIATP